MFKTKSVASIVSAFTKTIAELEKVVQVQQKKIEANKVKITDLTIDIVERSREVENANAVATKLKAIFN